MDKAISNLDYLKLKIDKGKCEFIYFDLQPYTDRDWQLIHVRNNEKAIVNSIKVHFSPQSSQSEMMYEKCIFLIRLPTIVGGDDWRFTSGGIEYVEDSSSDGFQDLSTNITSDNKTLALSVSDMSRGLSNAGANIEFRFIASLRVSGENVKNTYVSQDPAISIDRGEG